MAGLQVIPHQSCALEEGVRRGGSDVREAASLQRAGEADGKRRLAGHVACTLPLVDQRTMVHVRPQVMVQSTYVAQRLDGFGVLHDGRELASVADDAALRTHQGVHVGRGHGCDAVHVEVVERSAKRFSTVQHLRPRQSRLHPFQAEQLEQRLLAVQRRPPFLVVVPHVRRRRRADVTAHPIATWERVVRLRGDRHVAFHRRHRRRLRRPNHLVASVVDVSSRSRRAIEILDRDLCLPSVFLARKERGGNEGSGGKGPREGNVGHVRPGFGGKARRRWHRPHPQRRCRRAAKRWCTGRTEKPATRNGRNVRCRPSTGPNTRKKPRSTP